MLHNSGPYGPNDPPVNMGAPLNMTQMNGQPNLVHNLNNLGKMQQTPPPSSNSTFNVPDYSTFGHPPLSIGSPMSPFQNFTPVAYHNNYMQQSPNFHPDSNLNSTQNGILPINLNYSNEQNPNMGHHYSHFTKKLPDSSINIEYKDQSLFRKNMPINVPQIHTKAFHKQMGMDNQNTNYNNDHNLHQNTFRDYLDCNLDLSMKNQPKIELDHSRRRSLENTVKLIENILINSSSNAKNNTLPSNHEYDAMNKTNIDSSNMNPNAILENLLKNNSKDYQASQHVKKIDKSNDVPSNFGTCAINNEAKNSSTTTKNNDPLNFDNYKFANQTKTINFDNKNYTTSSKDNNVQSNVQNTGVDDQNNISSSNNNLPLNLESYNFTNKSKCTITSKDDVSQNIIADERKDNPLAKNSELGTINNEKMNYSDIQKLVKDDTDCKSEKDICETTISRENKYDTDEESTSESETDIKPDIIGKVSELETTEIVIKVEPVASWTDMEYVNPFINDVNGISREEVQNSNIIDAENSVENAQKRVKNGIHTECYLECPHCNFIFKNPKKFLIHVKWHTFGLTNDKRLEVAKEKEMQKYIRKEARLAERMNSKEVKIVPEVEGKTYPCKDCDKVFNVRSGLKNHRARYHPTSIRECKICRKMVPGWTALRAHMKTHTSESGYQCPECPKRFKYAHSLTKHKDTHLEKTHGCDQCPKKFGSATLLKTHMKTHERALRGATFRCLYCAKGFFESYTLQVHERINHRNERPFRCEVCSSNFGTNSGLKRHMKVSHSSSKPYECSICHRSFATESIRDHHEQRVHGDPEDFKFVCKLCPAKYLRQKDLQKHNYKVHPKGKRKKRNQSDCE